MLVLESVATTAGLLHGFWDPNGILVHPYKAIALSSEPSPQPILILCKSIYFSWALRIYVYDAPHTLRVTLFTTVFNSYLSPRHILISCGFLIFSILFPKYHLSYILLAIDYNSSQTSPEASSIHKHVLILILIHVRLPGFLLPLEGWSFSRFNGRSSEIVYLLQPSITLTRLSVWKIYEMHASAELRSSLVTF